MKKIVSAVTIATVVLFASCERFGSENSTTQKNIISGKWRLNSINPIGDTNKLPLVYLFLAMNVSDSNKIHIEFKQDSALVFEKNEVTERVKYNINFETKELHLFDSAKTIFTFEMPGDSLLHITTNDSVVLLFRKE